MGDLSYGNWGLVLGMFAKGALVARQTGKFGEIMFKVSPKRLV